VKKPRRGRILIDLTRGQAAAVVAVLADHVIDAPAAERRTLERAGTAIKAALGPPARRKATAPRLRRP
jgi:hypothetical protein